MTASLMQIIRHVESSDGVGQIRFEPGCYAALQEGRGGIYALNPVNLIARIATVNHCSPGTAQMIFATSWGVYQDMGFEIYGELCPVDSPTIWAWLANPPQQDTAFDHWCEARGFIAAGPLPNDAECARFAAAYNGPGDVANYIDLMKAAARLIV